MILSKKSLKNNLLIGVSGLVLASLTICGNAIAHGYTYNIVFQNYLTHAMKVSVYGEECTLKSKSHLNMDVIAGGAASGKWITTGAFFKGCESFAHGGHLNFKFKATNPSYEFGTVGLYARPTTPRHLGIMSGPHNTAEQDGHSRVSFSSDMKTAYIYFCKAGDDTSPGCRTS